MIQPELQIIGPTPTVMAKTPNTTRFPTVNEVIGFNVDAGHELELSELPRNLIRRFDWSGLLEQQF